MARVNVREQAEAEAEAGRLWRAKELLRNAITVYDPDLFERYGQILLQMRDLKEAGKWLFLSGRRLPEYQEAIDTFLKWCGARGGRKLYGSFPICARLGPPARYPEPLASELASLGVPRDVPPSWRYPEPFSWPGGLAGLASCLAVLLLLALCLAVGVVVVVRWLLLAAAG